MGVYRFLQIQWFESFLCFFLWFPSYEPTCAERIVKRNTILRLISHKILFDWHIHQTAPKTVKNVVKLPFTLPVCHDGSQYNKYFSPTLGIQYLWFDLLITKKRERKEKNIFNKNSWHVLWADSRVFLFSFLPVANTHA